MIDIRRPARFSRAACGLQAFMVLVSLALIVPAQADVPAVYQQISAGAFHAVGLRQDGTVWAWGGNLFGFGNGVLGQDADGARPAPMSSLPLQVQNGAGGFLDGVTAVAAGRHFSLALMEDGTLRAWGGNFFGQLGDGTKSSGFVPRPVLDSGAQKPLTEVTHMAAGCQYAVVLKSDGTVWAWGVNSSGQLGDGTDADRSLPVRVKGPAGEGHLSDMQMVAAGATHTVALGEDGQVWSWGGNAFGQLGDGTSENRASPIAVQAKGDVLTGFKSAAAGVAFTVALHDDGTVWAWGNNTFGQLGDGTREHRLAPVRVKGPDGSGYLSGVTAIAVGRFHTAALCQDGTVWTWGRNGSGELGDGSMTGGRSLPGQVKGAGGAGVLSDITAITAGYGFTAALCADGSVWSWGCNASGQLGDNTKSGSPLPVRVGEKSENMEASLARP